MTGRSNGDDVGAQRGRRNRPGDRERDEAERAGRLSLTFDSEDALVQAAAAAARRWADARIQPLVVAFTGDLGSGKTTWVRAMLRGLGYRERVPSPTYTLVEHYPIGGLTVVHLDLYRLADEAELENLGLRDWLAAPATWLLVEWPERSPALAALADLELGLKLAGPAARGLQVTARTKPGRSAVDALRSLLPQPRA